MEGDAAEGELTSGIRKSSCTFYKGPLLVEVRVGPASKEKPVLTLYKRQPLLPLFATMLAPAFAASRSQFVVKNIHAFAPSPTTRLSRLSVLR